MSIRKLTKAQKESVAAKQHFKCANTITDYVCPLWAKSTQDAGSFGEEKYHIDHIKEIWDGGDDSDSNLQALCLSCHSVKTKRNASERRKQRKEAASSVDVNKDNTSKLFNIQNLFDNQNYYIRVKASSGVSYSANTPDRSFIYDASNIPSQLEPKSYDFFAKSTIDCGRQGMWSDIYTYYTNRIDVCLNEEKYEKFTKTFCNVLKDGFKVEPGMSGSGRYTFKTYSFILQDAIDYDKIMPISHITFLTSPM